MAYTAWSVVFGEQPTAAKWNQLGTNDAGFKDGTNFDNDIIKSKHLDWAATGGGDNGGIWWEELARTTLASSGTTITASGFAARKYLRLLIRTIPTGGSNGIQFRVNNDSGNNYARQYAINFGAAVSSGSEPQLTVSSLPATPSFAIVDIINESSREKLMVATGIDNASTGAANAPGVRLTMGKWASTGTQITRVDVVQVSGSGSYASGSEIVVLGHD